MPDIYTIDRMVRRLLDRVADLERRLDALAEPEQAKPTALTEDATAAAYARGLADGRANPWRPMEEYDGQAAIVVWGYLSEDMLPIMHAHTVGAGYTPETIDFGWLPTPTPPAE